MIKGAPLTHITASTGVIADLYPIPIELAGTALVDDVIKERRCYMEAGVVAIAHAEAVTQEFQAAIRREEKNNGVGH